MLTADDRPAVAELAPALRRATGLDPRSLARLRLRDDAATVLVRLPFGVLVSRTVRGAARAQPLDTTVRATDLLDWLDAAADVPEPRDLDWRTGVPPVAGWRRIETVPDEVIRGLVRTGALALKDAAPRVADALLDSVVLTATDDTGARAEITLRALSALIRMGFLPRDGHAYVDAAGRWLRVVAEYGTVYLEQPGQTLRLG